MAQNQKLKLSDDERHYRQVAERQSGGAGVSRIMA